MEFWTMRRLFRLAALVGAALFCWVSEGGAGVLPLERDTLLVDRAQTYLETLQVRTAGFAPEFRLSVKKHAQTVAVNGLAQFKRTSDLRQTVSESVDFDHLRQLLHQHEDSLSNTTISRAMAFLANRFEQPSTWDLAVRVALPSRFAQLCRHSVLTRHAPPHGQGSRWVGFRANDSAALLSASSARFFDAGACKKSASLDVPLTVPEAASFIDDELPPTGYPSVVRTIILRI